MARPKKEGTDKRTKTVKIRYNDTELSDVLTKAKSAGKTTSDYIRGLTVNAEPLRKPVTPDRVINIKGLAELGKIGSNLNQIARAINRRQDSSDLEGVDPALLNFALEGVQMLTKQLLNELQHGHQG